MKGPVAVVLCLVGVVLIGGSYLWTHFSSPKADEEWVDTHAERYNELANDLHAQLTGKRTQMSHDDTKAEFREIQEDLIDARDSHERVAKFLWFSGLFVALVGVGVGLWARAEQPD